MNRESWQPPAFAIDPEKVPVTTFNQQESRLAIKAKLNEYQEALKKLEACEKASALHNSDINSSEEKYARLAVRNAFWSLRKDCINYVKGRYANGEFSLDDAKFLLERDYPPVDDALYQMALNAAQDWDVEVLQLLTSHPSKSAKATVERFDRWFSNPEPVIPRASHDNDPLVRIKGLVEGAPRSKAESCLPYNGRPVPLRLQNPGEGPSSPATLPLRQPAQPSASLRRAG